MFTMFTCLLCVLCVLCLLCDYVYYVPLFHPVGLFVRSYVRFSIWLMQTFRFTRIEKEKEEKVEKSEIPGKEGRGNALWFRTVMILDVSTGPLARTTHLHS